MSFIQVVCHLKLDQDRYRWMAMSKSKEGVSIDSGVSSWKDWYNAPSPSQPMVMEPICIWKNEHKWLTKKREARMPETSPLYADISSPHPGTIILLVTQHSLVSFSITKAAVANGWTKEPSLTIYLPLLKGFDKKIYLAYYVYKFRQTR